VIISFDKISVFFDLASNSWDHCWVPLLAWPAVFSVGFSDLALLDKPAVALADEESLLRKPRTLWK